MVPACEIRPLWMLRVLVGNVVIVDKAESGAFISDGMPPEWYHSLNRVCIQWNSWRAAESIVVRATWHIWNFLVAGLPLSVSTLVSLDACAMCVCLIRQDARKVRWLWCVGSCLGDTLFQPLRNEMNQWNKKKKIPAAYIGPYSNANVESFSVEHKSNKVMNEETTPEWLTAAHCIATRNTVRLPENALLMLLLICFVSRASNELVFGRQKSISAKRKYTRVDWSSRIEGGQALRSPFTEWMNDTHARGSCGVDVWMCQQTVAVPALARN